VPAGNAPRRALRFTGTAVEMADAAVLTRAVNRGEVVKASDIAIERRPKTELRSDKASTVRDPAGMAARRPLRAGEVLRATDLMKPDVVQRNEMVTLVYEVPGLMLTVRGKALDSGAQGDTISVLNVQSKRTVQGVVSGPGQVTIAAAAVRPAMQASATPPSETAGPEPR
jgi:flagellar basal body P-ring formation protein FlgA